MLFPVTSAVRGRKTQLGAVSQSRRPRGREGCKLCLGRAGTAAEMEPWSSRLGKAKPSSSVAVIKLWEAFWSSDMTPQAAWSIEKEALPRAPWPEALGRRGKACACQRAGDSWLQQALRGITACLLSQGEAEGEAAKPRLCSNTGEVKASKPFMQLVWMVCKFHWDNE